ncbi:hypothetical protein scyTo_0026741 [Scyliorhinus torazame]|uniref:Uncharacterized protein n=1 Tax=Scyliorhinus torazame TaxID=75743 RepID=A0A401QKT3_SCYTO|nr:hypothetical protein [Scyliorhinus torazame]
MAVRACAPVCADITLLPQQSFVKELKMKAVKAEKVAPEKGNEVKESRRKTVWKEPLPVPALGADFKSSIFEILDKRKLFGCLAQTV